MLDGALIQMSYRVKNDLVETHRLAFFPSPYLEGFQNEPDLYIEELVYAEVIWKNIVPFPLRFDFDSREGVYEELRHPKSHLTLGQYKNCRIPVCAPLTPYHFVSFLLRHFYHTAYQGNRPITSRIQWFYVQDFKQIVSIPTGLQPLGLNAAFQCFFLL